MTPETQSLFADLIARQLKLSPNSAAEAGSIEILNVVEYDEAPGAFDVSDREAAVIAAVGPSKRFLALAYFIHLTDERGWWLLQMQFSNAAVSSAYSRLGMLHEGRFIVAIQRGTPEIEQLRVRLPDGTLERANFVRDVAVLLVRVADQQQAGPAGVELVRGDGSLAANLSAVLRPPAIRKPTPAR